MKLIIVKKYCRFQGYPRCSTFCVDPEIREEILRAFHYWDDNSINHIAETLGYKRHTVNKVIDKRYNIWKK